jgi:hypothetical protein
VMERLSGTSDVAKMKCATIKGRRNDPAPLVDCRAWRCSPQL